MKSVICFLIGSFCSLLNYAQDWPTPGATWYYDQEYGLCFAREYSKWKYVGDSLKPEGRKLNFVRDVARLAYLAPGVVYKTFFQENQFFIDRNDSLFYGNSFLIADFNRVTGDSTFSPYYALPLESFCNETDSLMVLQKPLVTAHGVQTVGNRSFKWYRIQYLSVSPEDQSLVAVEKEFHQRYFTPEEWFLPRVEWLFCGAIFEYCYEVFQCYQDDFMSNSTCSSADYAWEHLNIEEAVTTTSVSVYPNPFSDFFRFQNAAETPVYYVLTDSQGREVMRFILHAQESRTIQTSTLPTGLYFLRGTDVIGNVYTQKLLKN